jgi:hypothetical protein
MQAQVLAMAMPLGRWAQALAPRRREMFMQRGEVLDQAARESAGKDLRKLKSGLATLAKTSGRHTTATSPEEDFFGQSA